jgi:hypothetical protein
MKQIKLFLLWLVRLKKDFNNKSIFYLLKVYVKEHKKLPQANAIHLHNLSVKKLILKLTLNKKY